MSQGFEVKLANKKELQELFEMSEEFLDPRAKGLGLEGRRVPNLGVVPPNPITRLQGTDVIIARVNGKIAGFVYFGRYMQGVGKIHALSVVDSRRKMTIGGTLLQVATKRLLQKYERVILTAAVGAEPFYEKLAKQMNMEKKQERNWIIRKTIPKTKLTRRRK